VFGFSYLRQSGVLPYRPSGPDLKILIILSRTSGNWIVPKGHLEPGLTARESAEAEALEEAGLLGDVGFRPIGAYTYRRHPSRGAVICRVRLFPMRVTQEVEEYDERGEREKRWVSADEAVDLLAYSGLRRAVSKLVGRHDSGKLI